MSCHFIWRVSLRYLANDWPEGKNKENAHMRAIVYHTYGSPDVLELQEVAKPVPKEHEILIHVHAAVVTPADIAFRKGEPLLGRVFTGLIRPRRIPGVEFAGDIEAV